MIVASHPDKAAEIIKVLDADDEEYAPQLSEEELDAAKAEYQRMSHDEISATIASLRQFGLVVD